MSILDEYRIKLADLLKQGASEDVAWDLRLLSLEIRKTRWPSDIRSRVLRVASYADVVAKKWDGEDPIPYFGGFQGPPTSVGSQDHG